MLNKLSMFFKIALMATLNIIELLSKLQQQRYKQIRSLKDINAYQIRKTHFLASFQPLNKDCNG